jgi:hypothetical protein
MQVRAADAMDLPVVVTEQYPKALGHTVTELKVRMLSLSWLPVNNIAGEAKQSLSIAPTWQLLMVVLACLGFC